MDYKLFLRSRNLRLKLLRLFDWIPDYMMLHIQYWIKTGRFLNLSNPVRFTEKIQHYKYYYRNKLLPICVDKYLVREYIISKNLSNCLNKLYGVYNNIREIDFSVLPKEFVIKQTDSGGGAGVYICKDKDNIEISILDQFSKWKGNGRKSPGREWAYYGLKPKIIVESLIIPQNKNEELRDFKFLCFNGEVKLIWVDIDRFSNHKRNLYDVNWNLLSYEWGYPKSDKKIEKPKDLCKMIEIAEILSKDFPQVRVDLYYENNIILFGELTFYTGSGYEEMSEELDFILGEYFDISYHNHQ